VLYFAAAAAAAALCRRLLDASLAILKEVDPELPNADISPDGKVGRSLESRMALCVVLYIMLCS
jgi:hypothetical protein